MTEYSEAFRNRMVERMSGHRPKSATALSREVGVPQPTLSKWLRDAATVTSVSKRKPKPKESGSAAVTRPGAWSAEEKVRVVLESSGLADAELGSFLRREGLHEEDLARFREDVRSAAVAGLTAAKKPRGSTTEEQRRIKELERDLKRSQAALAETAAILVLRKKAVALWGEEGDDT
jgi:transposase